MGYALAQAVNPIWYINTEHLFYLGLVKNRISRTHNRTWELTAVTRFHATGCLTGIFLYHLGEIEPAAYAFVAVMIYAAMFIAF